MRLLLPGRPSKDLELDIFLFSNLVLDIHRRDICDLTPIFVGCTTLSERRGTEGQNSAAETASKALASPTHSAAYLILLRTSAKSTKPEN